jgi:hypothetical protein
MALPVGRVTRLSPDATTICTAWVAPSLIPYSAPIRLLGVPVYGIDSKEWVGIDDLVKLVTVLIQALSR